MEIRAILFSIILVGSYLSLANSNPLIKNDNICQKDGIDPNGGLIQHESSCHHFYLCANGEPHLMECPEDLQFNPETKQCDWPSEFECPYTLVKENIPCNEYPEPKCPPHQPNKPAVHLPHSEDCRKFYECDWEVPYEKDCPEGLHFNANLQVCDFPEKAKCVCS